MNSIPEVATVICTNLPQAISPTNPIQLITIVVQVAQAITVVQVAQATIAAQVVPALVVRGQVIAPAVQARKTHTLIHTTPMMRDMRMYTRMMITIGTDIGKMMSTQTAWMMQWMS